MLKATVSGSFRRHMSAIYDAVVELTEHGVRVLSPADPRVVDQIGDFLFVASDRVRSIKLVEDRHLEAIQSSDFLWLVDPDGYVGQSASMELGYAVAKGTPIFSDVAPVDGTLKKYVRHVADIRSAISMLAPLARSPQSAFLIDPLASIQRAHADLEAIGYLFRRSPRRVDEGLGATIIDRRERLGRLLSPPTRQPSA